MKAKRYVGVITYKIVEDLYQHKADDIVVYNDIYTNNYHYSDDYMTDYITADLINISNGCGSYKDYITVISVNVERID